MKYCEHYAALLDPFVDGELSDEEADRVRAHLAQCEGCRTYVEAALMMRDVFADLEEAEVPDGFADGVMAAIRAHAAPRKKKAAPWVKVLLPLAACCAIVILVQGISRNAGLWSANTAAQTATDTAQAETEESSKALPDQAARTTHTRATISVAIHFLGSFESCSAGVSLISLIVPSSRKLAPEP